MSSQEEASSGRVADRAPGRPTPSPTWLRVLRAIGITIVWFILALLTLWAVAALYVDFRIAALRIPVTLIYVRWDYRNFIQAQTIPLGCRLVSRGLLLCARMVAHPEALERWQLATRQSIEQPGLKWTEIGSQFTICATATIAPKPTTRIAGATGHSIFHRSGPPTYS